MNNKKLNTNEQLTIIEGLTLLHENSDKSLEISLNTIDNIYRISHLNGSCTNEHLDWHKEGRVLLKLLHKRGII